MVLLEVGHYCDTFYLFIVQFRLRTLKWNDHTQKTECGPWCLVNTEFSPPFFFSLPIFLMLYFYSSDLFENWKPVSPKPLHPFCLLPYPAPLWQSSICSVYLWVYFCFLFIGLFEFSQLLIKISCLHCLAYSRNLFTFFLTIIT